MKREVDKEQHVDNREHLIARLPHHDDNSLVSSVIKTTTAWAVPEHLASLITARSNKARAHSISRCREEGGRGRGG